MTMTTIMTPDLRDVASYLTPTPSGEIAAQVATLAAIYSTFAPVVAERCVITSLHPSLDEVIGAIHQLAASRAADPFRFSLAQRDIARYLMPLEGQVSAKHRRVARLLSRQSSQGAVDDAVEYDELHYRAWRGFITGLTKALDAGRDASIESDEDRAGVSIVKAAGHVATALHHYYRIVA
jgi:hypothetical protein